MNSKAGCATMIVLFLIAAGISWVVTSGIIWLSSYSCSDKQK